MDEYICREAVINITAERGAWETQNRVRELPVADVQPVKHGRWIQHTKQIVDVDIKLPTECSECGFEEFSAEKYNFCPECGAKMLK